MDTKNPTPRPPVVDYSANVDTSRAFRSVKEAVEIFGERFLTGEIFLPSPKPPFHLAKTRDPIMEIHTKFSHIMEIMLAPREPEEPPLVLVDSLKKLELELEETKKELKLLKDRENETEVALKSLNAELHKNMSMIAKAEVAEKAIAVRSDFAPVKKKPIIPLVGDLFSRRKRKPMISSDALRLKI